MPPLPKQPVDRRREERFETTLAIRLEHGSGLARNVSASGIYFTTDVALEAGAPISFTLDFKDYPGALLRVVCAAKIVRIESRDGKTGVAAAIDSFRFVRVGGKTDEPEP
jgi:hypothetical protein